jgi:hypothetical protein
MTDHSWQVIEIVPSNEFSVTNFATRELFRITSIKHVGRETHCGVEMWNEATKSYRKISPLIFPDPATLPEVEWEDCPEWFDEDEV